MMPRARHMRPVLTIFLIWCIMKELEDTTTLTKGCVPLLVGRCSRPATLNSSIVLCTPAPWAATCKQRDSSVKPARAQ